MSKRIALTGNEAVANAMRQINPDVVAAYPITPATEIVQIFSQFVADGIIKTNFVTVESEHSAMSATLGAAASGARSMTATSSQGLALMWEMLYITSALRLPVVMPLVNRTLSGPINIHCDHSDGMGARDTGWLQLYSENAQEAYDNTLMAIRMAEHPDLALPVMVCMDGFITSHALENMVIEEDQWVTDWIGEYKIKHPLLDLKNPVTIGALDFTDYYFEHKKAVAEAMKGAGKIVAAVSEEFGKQTGRQYGLLDLYRMEDAEIAVVVLSSTAGTARPVVDALRADGIKAGLLKPRMFRPFPAQEIAEALKGVKAVAVLDRAEGLSAQGGPLFPEVRSALYDCDARPTIINYVYGLGGRDTGTTVIKSVYDELAEVAKTGKYKSLYNHLGVRE